MPRSGVLIRDEKVQVAVHLQPNQSDTKVNSRYGTLDDQFPGQTHATYPRFLFTGIATYCRIDLAWGLSVDVFRHVLKCNGEVGVFIRSSPVLIGLGVYSRG